jgi:hypothetical protein
LITGDAMHLRDFLKYQYEKHGWTVYSDFLEGKTSLPDGWIGAHPDLIGFKGSRRLAICIETDSNLRGEYASVRWKSILRNPDVSLVVVVRDKPSGDLVVQTAGRNGIELECHIVKRSKRSRKRGFVFGSLFRSRLGLFILMITIVIVFITSFFLLPVIRKKAEPQTKYYRPFDRERQVEVLKKEINELQKK